MRRKKWLLGLASFALAFCLFGGTARAQVNPNGWIQTPGWTMLFPVLNPLGANPGAASMKLNWIPPLDVGDPSFNPKCGDQHGEGLAFPAIDFGASPADGYNIGGLNPNPIWVTEAFLEDDAVFGSIPAFDLPSGDLVDYQAMVQDSPGGINQAVVPAIAGATALPNDNVMGIATTYVENITGDNLLVNVCTSSDDSIQAWVNNVCVANVAAARGSAADCQERNAAILPPGVSKITTLVWEGGGGWNFRFALEVDGVKLADGNGMVNFLGSDCPDTGLSGQVQYTVTRSVAADPQNCPPGEPAKVTITGDGTGEAGDALTVEECVLASDPGAISITGVVPEGTVADKFAPDPDPGPGDPGDGADADFIGSAVTSAFIGTDVGGGSGTVDEGGGVYANTSTSGGDIWTGGDDFQYDYTTVTGDFDLSIQFVERTHATGAGQWGKFGIMARQTLDRDSRFFMVQDHLPNLVDSARLAGRREHLNAGGGMFEAPGPIPHPNYIRLTRRGTVVTGWVSDDARLGDGTADPKKDCFWRSIASENAPDLPDEIFLGFANSEHNSEGAAAQTIRYKVLSGVPAVGCDPPPLLGKTITWETTRGDLNAGLCYNVLSVQPTTHEGQAIGETFIIGDSSINFDPNASGPVGIFGNSHDIGPVPTVGSTTFDGSVYTISGSGADIWDGGDQFHFAYKKVNGDFDARVHVADRSAPIAGTTWGRTGLMARWTCDASSKYSMGTVSSSENKYEPRHQWRVIHLVNGNTRNGTHVVNDGFFLNEGRAPTWQRLVRQGNALYSFMGEDDGSGNVVEWKLVGSDNHVGAPDTMLVGFAVSSHNAAGANRDTVVLDHVSIEPLTPAEAAACSAAAEPLQTLSYEDPADIGVVVVRGGTFTPVVADGRLRLTEDLVGSSATAIWYGVPASPGAGGVPLLSDGFVAEFDAYMSKGDGGCDPAADPNPADGFTFSVIATSRDDALASAVGPFPPGLAVDSLGGDGGGALGYDGGTLRERTECHPNFSVEMDNWVGGGEPGNEPADGGSSGNDCNWHVGLNVNGSVSSLQTNVDFGVATGDLPDIFGEEGVHMTVSYQASGQIDVWADGLHVLSYAIPPLPAGDVVLGFTGGTGGATARQEIDNFSISTACCEDAADTVSLSSDGDGQTFTVTATVGGIDDGASATCSFSASGPGTIVDNGDCTATVTCDGEGDITVSVVAGDTVCTPSARSSITVTCEAGGGQQLPGDCNQDGRVDISDAVCTANVLFLGIPQDAFPCGDGSSTDPANLQLLDWTNEGQINITSLINELNWLFLGGVPHFLGQDCLPIMGCPDNVGCP